MQDLMFSSLSYEQLKTEISNDIFNRIAPLIQTITAAKPETEYGTRKQAAKKLGISLPTLNEWTKNGTVKGYRIGSRVRYKMNELEQCLSQIQTRR
jgi:excisionase family DNA binding protein